MDIQNHVFIRGKEGCKEEIKNEFIAMGARNKNIDEILFGSEGVLFYLEEGFVTDTPQANTELYAHILANWKERKPFNKLKDLWIARDENKSLYVFNGKPAKYTHEFGADANHPLFNWQLPTELFPEVTWENSPKKLEYKLLDE